MVTVGVPRRGGGSKLQLFLPHSADSTLSPAPNPPFPPVPPPPTKTANSTLAAAAQPEAPQPREACKEPLHHARPRQLFLEGRKRIIPNMEVCVCVWGEEFGGSEPAGREATATES